MMTLRERLFATGEVAINYAEGSANGPAFVLLHGGSARWQYGRDLLEMLADDWHVYAPDFRGHGKSGRVPGAYILADYVRDTAHSWRASWPSPLWCTGTHWAGKWPLCWQPSTPKWCGRWWSGTRRYPETSTPRRSRTTARRTCSRTHAARDADPTHRVAVLEMANLVRESYVV